METLTIRKIKLNGHVHTWAAHLIEHDVHGRWLYTPEGSLVHNAPPVGDTFLKPMGVGTEPGFVWLMPTDGWWYGAWWERPSHRQTSIDACTIPSLVDGVWTWTDLELDICRDGDGRVWVEDEDEFDESLALGLIDTVAEAAARAVTAEMVDRLTQRVAPFADEGWLHHDAWITRGLPPLDAPI